MRRVTRVVALMLASCLAISGCADGRRRGDEDAKALGGQTRVTSEAIDVGAGAGATRPGPAVAGCPRDAGPACRATRPDAIGGGTDAGRPQGGGGRPDDPGVVADAGPGVVDGVGRDAGPSGALAAADGGVLGVGAATGWTDAELIADAPTPFTLDLALDVHGNAFVVWDQPDGEEVEDHIGVWASRYSAVDGAWGPPVPLDHADRTLDSVVPSVDTDRDGNAIAVWQRQSSELLELEIWSSRFDATLGEWAPAERLSRAGLSVVPQLIVHPDGDATVVWGTLEGLRLSLMASRYDAGGRAWSEPSRFDQATVGGGMLPVLASDPAGNAVVAFTQVDFVASDVSVQARRYDPQQRAWGPRQLVARDKTPTGNTTLLATGVAVNADGEMCATFQDEEDLETTTVWVSRYDQGALAWGEPVRLGTQQQELAQAPQVALDDAGNAVTAWSAWIGVHEAVWVNRYSVAEGSWDGARIMAAPEGASASVPQIATDARGHGVLVWRKLSGEGDTVRASRYDATADAWGEPTALDLGPLTEGHYPELAITPDGQALVVWIGWYAGVYANWLR